MRYLSLDEQKIMHRALRRSTRLIAEGQRCSGWLLVRRTDVPRCEACGKPATYVRPRSYPPPHRICEACLEKAVELAKRLKERPQ